NRRTANIKDGTANGHSGKQTESEKPKKKRKRRPIRRLVWAALAAGASAALFIGHIELRTGGPLSIRPLRNADIRTEIDGRIEEIRVSEGSVVHRGDLVARLSTREILGEL